MAELPRGQALAREYVDHHRQPHLLLIFHAVCEEVVRPDVILVRGTSTDATMLAAAGCPSSSAVLFLRHLPVLFCFAESQGSALHRVARWTCMPVLASGAICFSSVTVTDDETGDFDPVQSIRRGNNTNNIPPREN